MSKGRQGSIVTILVQGFGDLKKPRLILSSDPRLSEEEMFSLATAGLLGPGQKSVSELATGAGVEILSWAAGINQGLYDLLPGLLKNRETVNIRSLQLKAQKNYLQILPRPLVLMGLDLTNGLKLRIESPIFDPENTVIAKKLELEQYLTPSLRWRVVWETQDDMPMGDAGVDLWYSWEF